MTLGRAYFYMAVNSNSERKELIISVFSFMLISKISISEEQSWYGKNINNIMWGT